MQTATNSYYRHLEFLVDHADCAKLRALGTPAGLATALCVERRIAGYDETQPMHRLGAAPVHDALAVCAIIDPSVIKTEGTSPSLTAFGACAIPVISVQIRRAVATPTGISPSKFQNPGDPCTQP